mmetsp:Transcript_57520/g.66005  ORF Transcript_57520/g.66005 Transcript_57520/m.66005 type:complete len:789 (-) Transcript_57520:339-2705(-)
MTATQEAASGLWRSEDMTLVQLHMQREVVHDTVLKLGHLGMMQFQDLNKSVNAFQRDFITEVRRCDDMERKLRFLGDELSKANIVAPITTVEPETLASLERKLEERDGEVRELNLQFEALVAEKNRVREQLEVLQRDLGWNGTDVANGGLSLLCGVIPRDRLATFERLLFRITRGNAVVRTSEISQPFFNITTNEAVHKMVFSIMFSAPRLAEKLHKLCDVNGATMYPYAEGATQLESRRAALRQQALSLNQTLEQTATRRQLVLTQVANVVSEWKKAVAIEKAVFATMNLIQFTATSATARGWVPTSELDNVRAVLVDAERSAGAQVSTIVEEIFTREVRPTFFKTNKITSTFQGIVDSYGIARYKEVNPGVFTIITFPYLFGIMYGDVGHGLILTLFAAFLIFMEKSWEGKPLNEIFAMIFGGRYLLFAMGIFATYIGLLYNDMFGFSTELFTSGYTWPDLESGPRGIVTPTLPTAKNVKPDTPVAFGIDSAWAETENKLEFYNSVKMKCAVIIGIVQMLAGVVLSLTNHIYYNDWLHVYFRFIPEFVFLSCTFGYMALLIIMKWGTTWSNGTHDAPSLLETMTNFFLQPGSVTLPLYSGQAAVQVFLLLISFAMIPLLLCVIPYMENKHHEELLAKKRAKIANKNNGGEDDEDEDDEEEDNFDFSEIVIHQVIHTIEYVLGCVSNTASYLRLWALSLAHAQLSDVLWNFAFMATVGLDTGSGIYIFFGFAIWMSATLGILLGMESLSAFLHSLRLHWVEFNGKFFYGDGVAFQPFSVTEVIAAAA